MPHAVLSAFIILSVIVSTLLTDEQKVHRTLQIIQIQMTDDSINTQDPNSLQNIIMFGRFIENPFRIGQLGESRFPRFLSL